MTAPETDGVRIEILALDGIPEVRPGDDLASMIVAAYTNARPENGDILVVTSKVVSKAEGRLIPGDDREAAIDQEAVREVARVDWSGGSTRIVENRQGLVLAAAGVDASNVDDGFVLLLPEDPDASARAIASVVREATGKRVGVIVSDTLGRAWRIGQTDHAIGAAGVVVADDLRGTTDSRGRVLEATVAALGDELAAAADLAKGKTSGRPVAVIRGLAHLVRGLDAPGARALQRPASEDLFRQGAAEAWRAGYLAALQIADAAPPLGEGALLGPAGSETAAEAPSRARWTVVVPVKPGAAAKSRLDAPGVDRGALADAIAADTLAAIAASPSVAEIVVVGERPAAWAVPDGCRLRVVGDPGRGLRAAIAAGLATATGQRAVLLGDVPALRTVELDHALALAGTAARTFIPDADGTGTVFAAARTGMPIDPLFGADSAALHRSAGFTELHLPDGWGLRRDVDTAEHLDALRRTGRLGPRTTALLR